MSMDRVLTILAATLAIHWMASAAFASFPEDRIRQELLVDGGFVGPLPPPEIHRGGTVWDGYSGRIVGPTQPVFDLPRAGGTCTPWCSAGDHINMASVVMPGWSRDQSEPRVAVFDRQRGELVIWHGEDLSVPPRHRFSMTRPWEGGTIVDALHETSFERSDATHRIASGVMLPGLLLVMLERIEWTEGETGLDSGYAGVTIAALQESETGDWDWVMAEAVANDAPLEARDHGRGYISSMAAYYPVERVDDFQTAFIPFVDYLNHLSDRKAMGGQCGIFRVRREAVGDAWTIDPIVEIESSWGVVGEHYHVAGWTPAGVAISIGDAEFNRVALARCPDWDSYDDPSQWSVLPNWQGETGEGVPVLANQFWACCAGNHPTTLLVGGDNVSAAIYELEVPPEGDDAAPRMSRLVGDQPATLFEGSTATTASWLQRDRPEVGGPVVARWVCEGGGYPEFSRTLYSPDGAVFSTVARLPRGFHRLAIPFLAGGRLHIHRQNGAGLGGLMSSRPPAETPSRRGLVVRPGGLDLLRDELGRHRPPTTLVPTAGISVELVDPGTLEAQSGWRPAPDAVCYRVHGTTTGELGRLLTASFEDWRRDGPKAESTAIGLHMWVCNLLPGKLLLRTNLDRGGQVSKKSMHIASTDDWNECDVWSTNFTGPLGCTVELNNGAGPGRPAVDFLVVFRSLTAGGGPPGWMLDPVPNGMVPGDRVDFPTPIRSDDWAVEVELQVPPEAADFSVGSRMPILPICTWMFGGGGHVTLSHRLGGGRYQVEVDGSLFEVDEIASMHLVRGDSIVARLSRRDGDVRLHLQSGGSLDSEVTVRTLSIPHRRRPVSLRIGGPDHELFSALVVRRVAVETTLPRPIEVIATEEPPVAETRRERRARPVRPGSNAILEVMRRMGESGVDLPRRVDLDGDGMVSVFDLAAAIRVSMAPGVSPDRSNERDR